MPFKKIELHEVEENLKQAKESAEAVRGLQDELEDVLAKYNDNSKRYAAGELSRQEFSDLTASKDGDVKSLNDKVKSNLSVITSSIDTVRGITVLQEPVDEAAEVAVAPHEHIAHAKKHVKHVAPKHHKKKK